MIGVSVTCCYGEQRGPSCPSPADWWIVEQMPDDYSAACTSHLGLMLALLEIDTATILPILWGETAPHLPSERLAGAAARASRAAAAWKRAAKRARGDWRFGLTINDQLAANASQERLRAGNAEADAAALRAAVVVLVEAVEECYSRPEYPYEVQRCARRGLDDPAVRGVLEEEKEVTE